MKKEEAHLIEIFSSLQGEGPHVGERMIFVRFQGCDLKCRWCDTPESFSPHAEYRVEKKSFSGVWETHPNPVAPEELSAWLDFFFDPWVSLTGGEPLQQVDFLETWLPGVASRYSILLETNGVLPQALERVLPWIHTVSMDIKLPTSAKTGVFWKEHDEFLKIACRAPECYVKMVITEQTSLQEVQRAVGLVRKVGTTIPLILQPVSPTRSFRESLSTPRLKEFLNFFKNCENPVRIIPQMHKFLQIL